MRASQDQGRIDQASIDRARVDPASVDSIRTRRCYHRRPLRSEGVCFVAGVMTLLAASGRAAADAPSPDGATERGSAPAARPDPPIVATLDIHAPASCATREALMGRVLARAPRIRFTDGRDATVALRATLQPTARGLTIAELVTSPTRGPRATRRLTAKSCAEAVDALALVIVMALDPASESPDVADAGSEPSGSDRPPTKQSAPEAGPRAPTAEPPTVESEETTPEIGPPPPPPRPRSPPPPRLPPSPRASLARYAFGVTAGALFGPAPGALPAVGGFLSAEIDRSSVWSPALRLSARHGARNRLVEPGGTARFALDSLSADLCPLLLRASSLQARPCGSALGGRLAAEGSSTYSPGAFARPFAGLGASLLIDVDLGRHLLITGRVGAIASLIRDSFAFTPEVFHRVAWVTLDFAAGLALRFP